MQNPLDCTQKKILVRMPNWLGDAVMATPVLEDLKRSYPNAKVTALSSDVIATLLQGNPYVDEAITFSRKGALKSKETKRITELLSSSSYDFGILLTGSFSSAWQLYRAKIPSRIGYPGHFRKALLTEPVPYADNYEKEHLVISYKKLLAPLDISLSDTSPHIYISKDEQKSAQKLLESHDISSDHTIIGINPGAAYGSAKCWPKERFRELTERLLKNTTIRVLYFGEQSSKPLIDDICRGLPLRVVNLVGKTNLRELFALINSCTLIITNDSGPMHVAAALKKDLVAIFGSTNDIKTGPYGIGRVIHHHVPCSPCYLRSCPIDFRCMTSISVDEVIQQIPFL
ncbi:MAG: rfaF [Chlamydiia bacterium]|nr:rfaF [Chlamydiia bacterium]